MDAESQQVEELKAEVERLKGMISKLSQQRSAEDAGYFGHVIIKQKQLITELCDALELGNKLLPDVREIVLQRAREATR